MTLAFLALFVLWTFFVHMCILMDDRRMQNKPQPTWMYVVTRKMGGIPLSMSWWLLKHEACAEYAVQQTQDGITELHERQLDGSDPVLLQSNAQAEPVSNPEV